MDDLETMLAKMLNDVGRLPLGQERYDLLKEIGRIQEKLDSLKKRKKSQKSITGGKLGGKGDPFATPRGLSPNSINGRAQSTGAA